MDSDNTIMMFHAGRFSTEAAPPWLVAIRERRCKGMDWNKATLAVLGYTAAHVTIGDDMFPLGEMRAYPTPGGGRYVELSEGEISFAEIWVAEATEWLPFNSAYVEPFQLTRATLYQADRTERLGNALIAFGRHGAGRHIDRDTGDSQIDHREDWEREKRQRAQQRALIAAHFGVDSAFRD